MLLSAIVLPVFQICAVHGDLSCSYSFQLRVLLLLLFLFKKKKACFLLIQRVTLGLHVCVSAVCSNSSSSLFCCVHSLHADILPVLFPKEEFTELHSAWSKQLRWCSLLDHVGKIQKYIYSQYAFPSIEYIRKQLIFGNSAHFGKSGSFEIYWLQNHWIRPSNFVMCFILNRHAAVDHHTEVFRLLATSTFRCCEC